MRFDLSGCGAGLDESAKDLLELGPFAERLGYDGLWINEEHFGQGSRVCFSPILVATALAMRTRTIRIGFSVLVLPLFEPIRLAEEIATLDVLSEGRVDLGVSRGNTSRYFEARGLDYEDRSAAFDAVFDKLMRAIGRTPRSRSAPAPNQSNRNASSSHIRRFTWRPIGSTRQPGSAGAV